LKANILPSQATLITTTTNYSREFQTFARVLKLATDEGGIQNEGEKNNTTTIDYTTQNNTNISSLNSFQ
jgi:hypothetical protein